MADARRFVRCAHKDDLRLLRDAIDGPPNQAPTAWALDRIIRTNSACYQGLPINLPAPAAPYYGECNPQFTRPGISLCQALYDRGALLEYILHDYAPGLDLTSAQTMDPEVQARFAKREGWRNRSRMSIDKRYFDVTGCLVMFQPERSIALLNAESGSGTETRLRNSIIGRAPVCVGGAKKVSVDPIQFRIYLTEAVYSWAVAARGTDSLLPEAKLSALDRKR